MTNILITGSNGQLGSELKALARNHANYNFIFTDVEELNICNHKEVAEFLSANSIDVIINCAAYTAVDKAEEQVDLANTINNIVIALKTTSSISKANSMLITAKSSLSALSPSIPWRSRKM